MKCYNTGCGYTGSCIACERRNARARRRARIDAGHCDPIYIAALETTRHYGGPEEGGWYYDWTDVVEVRRAYDWRAALRAIRELRDEHPTCPRGRGSVLGGADVCIALAPDSETVERWQSDERPTYC